MKFLNQKELELQLALFNRFKGNRDSIILRLALFTGARGIEVVNILKSDLKEQSVFIRGAKGSSDRLVPVPKDFYEELTTLSQSLNPTDRVFPIGTRQFRKIWDKWRVNRTLGAHCLRHTLGVQHYSKNTDIHATRTLLGHKNILNTMKYLDFVESQAKLKKSMNGLWKTPKPY